MNDPIIERAKEIFGCLTIAEKAEVNGFAMAVGPFATEDPHDIETGLTLKECGNDPYIFATMNMAIKVTNGDRELALALHNSTTQLISDACKKMAAAESTTGTNFARKDLVEGIKNAVRQISDKQFGLDEKQFGR